MSKVGLLVSLLMLCSVSAFAVDGIVLINQASVMAAGGFPYTITQSGSYKLSGNLIVSGFVNGVVINASSVTLDLNGFSISGPVTCSGQPVSCVGLAGDGVTGLNTSNDLTIKNGTITGMSRGVILNGSGELVEEIHASQNSFGGIVLAGSGIVRRCTAASNGSLGIGVFHGGVVEANLATSNGFIGINAQRGATVISNGIVSNGDGSTNSGGLFCFACLYGSNALNGNSVSDIAGNFGGGTSQNNNNCSGTIC